jgi:hypothetical protein
LYSQGITANSPVNEKIAPANPLVFEHRKPTFRA